MNAAKWEPAPTFITLTPVESRRCREILSAGVRMPVPVEEIRKTSVPLVTPDGTDQTAPGLGQFDRLDADAAPALAPELFDRESACRNRSR